MNIKEIASRIKKIRREYSENRGIKTTQEDFAKELKVSYHTYKGLEIGKNAITLDKVNLFKDKLGVNPTWLLYGEGKMYLKDDINKEGLIPYYNDIRASAGFGAINGEVTTPEYLHVPPSLCLNLHVNKTEAIRCSGDSMYPNIKDGDVMFIDRSDCELKDGEVYVVRMGEEVFVKRLFRVPGKILAKSDNETYPAFDLDADFEILGRVIYSMQRV